MCKKLKFLLCAFLIFLVSLPIQAQILELGFAALFSFLMGQINAKYGLFDGILWEVAGRGSFCWFCPIIGGTFEALNRLAALISTTLQDVFVDLVSIGLLFFIAFKTARLFTQMTEPSAADFATELLKPLLRGGFALLILLSFPFFIFEWIAEPIMNVSVGLSQAAFQKPGTQLMEVVNDRFKKHHPEKVPEGSLFSDTVMKICDPEGGERGIDKTLPPWMHGEGEKNTENAIFSRKPRNQILSVVCNYSAASITGVALGITFLSTAFENKALKADDGKKYHIPALSMLVTGGFLTVFYLFLLAVLPFKFIDTLLRLFFTLAFTPLFLVFWVFPLTVKYTMRGWAIFLSCMLNLFFLSFVAGLVGQLLPYIIPNKDVVLQYLADGDIPSAANAISITTIDFLITFIITLMCPILLNVAETLATEFGSVPIGENPLADIGIGSYLGQTTGGATSKLFGATTRLGGYGLGKGRDVIRGLWKK